MLPPLGRLATEPSVVAWQKAQLIPTLSPAKTSVASLSNVPFSGPVKSAWFFRTTTPMTALASTRATVLAGSWKAGILVTSAPAPASAICAAITVFSAAGTLSMSTDRPAASACAGVTPLATIPCGNSSTRVQYPSFPSVSNRKTCCPSPASGPRGARNACGPASGPEAPGSPPSPPVRPASAAEPSPWGALPSPLGNDPSKPPVVRTVARVVVGVVAGAAVRRGAGAREQDVAEGGAVASKHLMEHWGAHCTKRSSRFRANPASGAVRIDTESAAGVSLGP